MEISSAVVYSQYLELENTLKYVSVDTSEWGDIITIPSEALIPPDLTLKYILSAPSIGGSVHTLKSSIP
jgi:hypothetical protein